MANARQCLVLKANHGDTRRGCRWMAEDVGEIAIKGHECASLGRGDRQESLIAGARQLLIPRESDIVARCSKESRDAVGDVLVELYSNHDQVVTGTMLSRARSAAYAKAAGIASVGNVGKSVNSSSGVTPAARLSSTIETGMRVSRNRGHPCKVSGVATM